ncbi:helix-turn-helix transcriptional regulator [Polaribacter sargassicola]|uniref:helix-turn-helix transcriptional regulator n=1 Tax=Polaribacter sargassicola TaxID=2836891 RepID=UPI001F3AC617|nr:response regulator transcription factor [Polaribacter sp. DS7-9]MCG1036051.1 helix-turn-helix transcriptional regulator [Polaribacter sp. DS7-9]
MIEIEIIADSPKDLITQIHDVTGGSLVTDWNESVLTINNEYATGIIRFIPFDWGVNLLDFELKLHKEFILKIKADEHFNPIRFIYPSLGYLKHRFGVQNEVKQIDQFQSLIFTNKTGGYNYLSFPKNESVNINVIQITRKHFLKKRTTNVSTLSEKLYDVFMDTDHENRFSNYGTLNLKMADLIRDMKKVKGKGMLRILKIEAKVYEILSHHIQQHNRILDGQKIPNAIDKSELKIVRKIGNNILKNPAKEYTLEQISENYGLTQAKLQEGFKFLYKRTVTEYIRHIRLESARNMLKNTDLNISQVVYSVGFSSRSYFSKIFKEKYDITPNQFKKNLLTVI